MRFLRDRLQSQGGLHLQASQSLRDPFPPRQKFRNQLLLR
jgi:hypothetical protein